MKLNAIYIIFFITLLIPRYAQAIISHYDNKIEVINKKRKKSLLRQKKKINRLAEAKKEIFKGNYKKARYLTKLISNKSKYYPLKLYYLAIINFLTKNYQESSAILASPILNTNSFYTKICLLKILSYLATGKKKIKREISRCQKHTFRFSDNQQLWLNYLIQINNKQINLFNKKNSKIYLKNFLTDIEFTKIVTKLALFNNQPKMILKQIQKFNPDFYQDEELKELVAFIYYRLGNNKMVFKFLENVNTPNAENLKGNIFLKARKYEIALGHFQLALKYNPASKNAMYRILPLAWILNKYDLAIEVLEKLRLNKQEIIPFAYYLTLLSKTKNIKKLIMTLNFKFNNYKPAQIPIVITQVISYLNILIKDSKELRFYSKFMCSKGDIISCQQFRHVNFDQDLLTNIKGEKYKLLEKKILININKEVVYIDQVDVLELDLKNKDRINYGSLY